MIGDKTRYAEGMASVGTLSFVYTVQPDDLDTNGISIPANPIDLNGGTIKDWDSGVDVNLSHPGLSDESGPTVDGSKGEGLIYSSVPNTLAVGTTITPLTATPVNFAEGATFTYEVTAGTLPPGLSLDTSTGAITGTPTTVSATVTDVTITVTAGTGMNPSTAARRMSFPAVSGPLVFDPTALMVNEGSSGTYTVKLASQPSASVTVAVTGAVGEVTMNPTSLTFNSTTWNTAQTVTVTAGQDDDANDDSATLVHTTTGGDYAGVTDSVAVTVDDDDQSLTYSAAPTTLMVGTPITALTATATNFTGTPSYSVTTGSLPAGLRISASTGEITGTPTAASTSTTTVTVTAGTGTDTQTAMANITFPAITVTFSVTGPNTIGEGAGTATYRVSLSAPPSANVTINYATADGTATAGSDYTAASGTLTFTPANWETGQTVDVTITDDTVDDDDETFTFTLSNPGSGAVLSRALSLSTTIIDDDSRGLMLPAFSVTGPTTVAEHAGTATYTVTLSAQPSATVTVGYATRNGTARAGADYRAKRGTLTFTPTNWNTAQTVAVTIINNRLDDDGKYFFFRLSNPGTGTVLSSRASSLSTIITTPLCYRTRDVIIPYFRNPELVTCLEINNNHSSTSFDLSGLSRFSNLNSLYISLNNRLRSIDFSGLSGLSSLNNLVIDNNNALRSLDFSGLSSLNNLEIRSNGRLSDTSHRGLVSIDFSGLSSLNSLRIIGNPYLRGLDFSGLSGLSSLNSLEIRSNGLGLRGLDFSGLSGLSSLHDLHISDNNLTSINFSGLSGLSSLNDVYIDQHRLTSLDFSGLSSVNNLYIRSTSRMRIDFSCITEVSSLEIGGGFIRSGSTIIALRELLRELLLSRKLPQFKHRHLVATDRVCSAEPEPERVNQAPTITPIEDLTVTMGDNTVVTITATDPEEDPLQYRVVAWTSEDKPSVSVAVSPTTLTDFVSGESQVQLTTMAEGTATITITLSDGTNEATETFSVTVVESQTSTENDTRGVTLSTTTLRVNEGDTESYTVLLDSEPTGDVMVTIGGTDNTDITVDTDPATPGDQTTLTFTPTNWSTPRMVTVTAADDDDAVNDPAVTLTHTASGGDYASLTGPSLSVTITENDTRGVMLSTTTLTVNEEETESYTVVLNSEPTGDVMVTIGGTDNTDITVDTDPATPGDQTTLTFTPTNWSTPRTVTVVAADDNDAVNDAAVTLTHAVTGADYGSERVASVAVTIIENDAATFSVNGPATIGEGAGTATYTVSLSAPPSANVTINYATADGTATAGSDYMAASDTLTFTPANWQTEQTVDVTITDDTVDDDDETFTFTLSNPGSGAVLSASRSLSTTIVDDDVPVLTVSFAAATYSVTEGATVSVAVSLSAIPERSVTIPLTATNGTGATSSDYSIPSSITFASTETSKTLTFSATDDAVDEDNETVTLGFGTLPPRLTAGTTSQTAVTIMDDDSRGLMLSATSLAVNENAFGTYTVALSSQPTTNVTVTVDGATGDVSMDTDPATTGDQTTLTFTPTNWSTARMVTVTAADDDDAVNDPAVTLTHTASGGDYASLTGPSLSVTITENDSRGVTLSTTNLRVNEEDTESYTVLLDSEPTGNVTVTIGGTDNTDITVDTDPATTGDQPTLTFTPANWSTAQVVTVAAADDDDSVTDTAVTLTHTASGGDYASLTGPSLSVTIIENDAASFDEVNTEILPSIINQVAENQVAIITSRSEIISSGLNSVNLSMEEIVTDVADYLFSHHQEIQANDFDWRQALSGKNFSFTLAETSAPQSGMDDGKLSSSGSGPLSFWGAIDYSSLQDKTETISLDGDTLSFNFGVDKEFTSDLVLGVLLSIANSEFDLTGRFTGTYEVDLSTLNPYISWEASEDLSLWASVGYGRGQVDLTDDSTNPPVSERSDFTRFSAGGRFQLWQSETGTGLALKLDGTTAHFLGADVQRSRLATELSHDFSIESGVLNTALELGLLMSSADESAAELVGRLHWRGDAGLSSSIQSRVLLGGGDRQEWGIGGALRYTAGGGEGLMMSLEPSFGISNPQLLPDLWQVTTSNPATTTAAPTARLNAKLAYGFPRGAGLLTPYTKLSFSAHANSYGAGLRYGLEPGLEVEVEGRHHRQATGNSDNRFLLQLRSDL